MDKKNVLIISVFAGIGIYAVPIFVNIGVGSLLFKIVGGLVMMAGVVYFIAGDVLTGGNKHSKEIKRKVKSGEITQEQAFELEMKALDLEIAKQQKMYQLEKKKAEIKKLKQPPVQQGQQSSSKMPNVLGNLGPMINGNNGPRKRDMFDNLGSIVDPKKPKPKKKKKQDNFPW